MAHPHNSIRQHKVEHSRVGHIVKGYASGGEVAPRETNKKIARKAIAQRDAQAVEGTSAKERLDRPNRARGGKVGKHKGTNVNVIVAPQGAPHAGLAPPAMAAPMAPPPGALPPRPMAAPMPPPGGPPMMAGAPPPGMPPRHNGGRTYAKGGAVTDSAVYKEGRRNGTQVQNNPSGKNDQRDVGRSRVVTFRAGGAVKLPGGSGGGEARLAKQRLAKRSGNGMAP